MSTYHIISGAKCPWCEKAMDLLESCEIDYTISYIDRKPWLKTIMKQAGLTTVPQVFDGEGTLIGGYEALSKKLS
jgi:glutaredoxin